MMQRSWAGRNMATVLGVFAFASTILTYLALTGNARFAGNAMNITALMVVNLSLLLVLGAVVLRRIYVMWGALRRGAPGAKLQKRIVLLFSIVTIAPTLVVSVFSTLFFNLGVQAWFNDRIKTALFESLTVAESYLREHTENLRGDAVAMAGDLNQELLQTVINAKDFNRVVSTQAALRSLTEAIVIQNNKIIAQSALSFSLGFEEIPLIAIERATRGEVVVLPPEQDKVRALIRLDALPDTYLLVGRLVDSKVLNHMEKTQGAVNEYRDLKQQLGMLQIVFSAVFGTLTLLLLLAAVWYGMVLASSLVRPVSTLASAAERVRAGDFSVKVPTTTEYDELEMLARAFNRMTDQLENQRGELIEANRRLDERRRFTETVLSGVSAGVVALDVNKRVSLYNPSAASILLASSEEALEGKHISEIIPGITEDLAKAEQNPDEVIQSTIGLERNGRMLTLHVRISIEHLGDTIEGYIVTFDDITVLVAAQRNAAWADVARRIAHEIKNPLTPIQLAAERLKRKYLQSVDPAEAENFSRYTDTIVRHVGDIGKMVEEFVSFARMPAPVFKSHDLNALVKAALFSEQCAHPGIDYNFAAPEHAVEFLCDERQINQVLTNLLKNAAEAIEGQNPEAENPGKGGKIALALKVSDGHLQLEITDNGPGFPPGQLQKVLEPYVTNRAKGTGLGLAIVKKIIDDHKGRIILSNLDSGGARIALSFPRSGDINAS